MKNLLFFTILIASCCISERSIAQRTTTRYLTLNCNIQQVGSSSGKPHVSCNCNDQGGTYDASNVIVGDTLYFNDSGVGYKLPVDSIVTPGTPTIVVRADWTGLGLVSVPTGRGSISRGAANGLDGTVAGLTPGDDQYLVEDWVSNIGAGQDTIYLANGTPVINGDTLPDFATGGILDQFPGSTTKFASDTSVNPDTTGAPSVQEIKDWNISEDTVWTNSIVYYTGTDDSTDVITYVYYIDGNNIATLVESPADPVNFKRRIIPSPAFANANDPQDSEALTFINSLSPPALPLTIFVQADGAVPGAGTTDNPETSWLYDGTNVTRIKDFPRKFEVPGSAFADSTEATGIEVLTWLLSNPQAGNYLMAYHIGSGTVDKPDFAWWIAGDTDLTSADIVTIKEPGSVADGDKTDIDVSSSGAVWTIDTSAVTTIKIANDAVTGAKIAASTIDSTDIATGGIGNTDLAAGIVTTGKIADANVTWSKIDEPTKDSIRLASVTAQDSFNVLFHNERTFTNVSDYDAFVSLSQGNGKILLKYMSGSGHASGQTIRVKKSTDNGKTWTGDIQVAGNGATGGSIAHIGQDSFIVFYWREYTGAGLEDTSFWRISTDAGATWGAENPMPNYAPFASYRYGLFVDGRAITNFGAAGTWYVPIWGKSSPAVSIVGIAKTTNYGSTWAYNFVNLTSTDFEEPELIVKGDSLVLYIRGGVTNKVWRTSSIDGVNYSAIVDVTPSGNFAGRPAAFISVDGTVILAGRTAAGTQQEKYTYIAQSFDGGLSFPIVQQIFKSGWYTYGDFVEIERGKLLYAGGVDTMDYTKSIVQLMTVIFHDKLTFAGTTQVGGGPDRFSVEDLGLAGQVLTVNADQNAIKWTTPSAVIPGTNAQTLRYNGTTLTANSLLANDGTYVKIGSPPSGTNTKLDVNGTVRIRGVSTVLVDGVGLYFDRQDNTDVRYNSISYKIDNLANTGNSYFNFNLANGTVGATLLAASIRNDSSIFYVPAKFKNTLRIDNLTPTPTTLLGATSTGNLGKFTSLQNIIIGSGSIAVDTNAMAFTGVTRLLGGGSDPTPLEQLRLSRPVPNDINRYHSIWTQHSGTAANNYIEFRVHDGVTATPPSVVNSFRITGAGTVSALVGYQINGAATSGNYLRGNGTNFVSSAIQASDIAGLIGTGSAGTSGFQRIAFWKTASTIDDKALIGIDTANASMGIGTATPSITSVLDLTSTTKGFLAPRMTTTQRNAIASPATGLQVYNTSLNKLNYYNGSAWQALVDSTTVYSNFFLQGGNSFGAAATMGTNDVRPLHFETNNTRRLTIPSSGITSSTTASKMLTLDSNDSLKYNTVISSDWSGTVTQSGSDTLLNSAIGYGHFQRIGNVVSFTLRVEIALTSAGDANTVYIDPPIASNFTTAASDVIGTATMDPQSLSGANTQRQRCVVFASDSDDKIGVSFDPVASLSYPENRMYISVSGSYVIQ